MMNRGPTGKPRDVITGGHLLAIARRAAVAADRLLTVPRLRFYCIVLLLFALATYVPVIVHGDPPFDAFGHPVAVDLVAHVTAGKMMLNGDLNQLYDVQSQWAAQQVFLGNRYPDIIHFYISPPFVAVLYVPFAVVPYLDAAILWTILTLGLLALSLRLLWPIVPNLHRYGFGSILIILLSSWPVIELLVDGQDSAVSLLLLVAGLRLLLARRDLAAGGVLGLGVFKPQLFLLIPVLLLFRRQWRALAGWFATVVAVTVLSLIMVGPRGSRGYLALITSPSFQQGTEAVGWKMLSLEPLAHALFGGLAVALATPVTLAIDAVLLAAFARTVLKSPAHPRQTTLLFAMTILVGSVVSPYFFVYDGVVLLLPSVLLLDEATTNTTVRLSVVVGYVLTWTTLIRYSAFGHATWPGSLLAAPWTVVPLIALTVVAQRLIRVHDTAGPAQLASVDTGPLGSNSVGKPGNTTLIADEGVAHDTE